MAYDVEENERMEDGFPMPEGGGRPRRGGKQVLAFSRSDATAFVFVFLKYSLVYFTKLRLNLRQGGKGGRNELTNEHVVAPGQFTLSRAVRHADNTDYDDILLTENVWALSPLDRLVSCLLEGKAYHRETFAAVTCGCYFSTLLASLCAQALMGRLCTAVVSHSRDEVRCSSWGMKLLLKKNHSGISCILSSCDCYVVPKGLAARG